MKIKSVRTEEDIELTFNTYADMIYSISLIMLKNSSDAEDIVQETFIRYIQSDKKFDNEEHKKAWLITVASNQCRDLLRFENRHRTENIEEITIFAEEKQESCILEALAKLPEKFRIIMLLHYVYEYKVKETADILGIGQSAAKMRLKKGRELLREIYRKEYQ